MGGGKWGKGGVRVRRMGRRGRGRSGRGSSMWEEKVSVLLAAMAAEEVEVV